MDSLPRHWMEVSGKLQAPAELHPEESPRYPLDGRLFVYDDHGGRLLYLCIFQGFTRGEKLP
jgi:hypothetical protein